MAKIKIPRPEEIITLEEDNQLLISVLDKIREIVGAPETITPLELASAVKAKIDELEADKERAYDVVSDLLAETSNDWADVVARTNQVKARQQQKLISLTSWLGEQEIGEA